MCEWFGEVMSVCNSLDIYDKFERFVYGMLLLNFKERVIIKDIVGYFFVE